MLDGKGKRMTDTDNKIRQCPNESCYCGKNRSQCCDKNDVVQEEMSCLSRPIQVTASAYADAVSAKTTAASIRADVILSPSECRSLDGGVVGGLGSKP